MKYVERLESYLSSLQYGTLATLVGRYYAMDRDKRYERTKLAFEGLVKGQGETVARDSLIQVSTDHLNTCHPNITFLSLSLPENGGEIQFER